MIIFVINIVHLIMEVYFLRISDAHQIVIIIISAENTRKLQLISLYNNSSSVFV